MPTEPPLTLLVRKMLLARSCARADDGHSSFVADGQLLAEHAVEHEVGPVRGLGAAAAGGDEHHRRVAVLTAGAWSSHVPTAWSSVWGAFARGTVGTWVRHGAAVAQANRSHTRARASPACAASSRAAGRSSAAPRLASGCSAARTAVAPSSATANPPSPRGRSTGRMWIANASPTVRPRRPTARSSRPRRHDGTRA